MYSQRLTHMEFPRRLILKPFKLISVIVLLFGSFIPVPRIIKLIDSMNVVYICSVSVHHNNMHVLAIEMYKVHCPCIICKVFIANFGFI